MSELDPNEATTSIDVDATSVVPTPTAPLTPTSQMPTYPTPQPYEPGVAWAPAVPVVATSTPRRGGRLRWAAAIAVVALVVAASGVVAALITGSSADSTVLGYVPERTIVYGEVRLDLPGDQRRAVGEFLQKFPGFADQAALDTKLDEVLDEFVKGVSNGEQTYSADIKPWFDGELAISVGPLPPAASLPASPSSMDGFRALALLSIKEPVAAQAWFDAAIKKSGATTTTETYQGATLTVVAEGNGPKAAFALIDGKVAVVGDLASVKAAVDTKGDGGFASEPGPKAALGSADGDHVGFMYIALKPLLAWSTDLSQAVSPELGGAAGAALSGSMLKTVPDWTAFWLRIESDAVVMEATAPKPETPFGPTQNRTSSVVEHIPSSALVVSVSNDFGATLKQMLALYSSDPAFKEMLGQLDQGLGLVGGTDAALGWVGDTAIVVNAADGTPEGGLIVAPTDKAAADRLFTALRAFIAVGGGAQGITVREEPYAGTTITIVDLGDLSKVSGMGGAAASGLPLPTGHLEIAYAVTDDIVVVGTGPAFVKHVLDTTKATSLASDEQYTKIADRAGKGTSTVFVDITGVRELAEKWIAAGDTAAKTKYETDVRPFLLPFDAMFASSSTGGDLTSSTVIITVK